MNLSETGARERPGKRKKKKFRLPLHRNRLKIHPLFLLLGVYYCFIGELPIFLLSALVALQHECAHAFAAAKLGYKLDRVVLMPYGAVIDGDLSGISLKDEFFVAVWGPLCNLFTAAGFAALWWFWPDTYAFTDTACFISLAIGLVNFIPAYPLDGGRVLKCALRTWVKEKSAERICRGVEIRRVAVEETCPLKRAVGFIERDKYLILDVYDEKENYLGEIGQNELAEIFSRAEIYDPVGDFL